MVQNLNLISDKELDVLADKISTRVISLLDQRLSNSTNEQNEKFVGIKEVANYLNLSKQTIYGKVNKEQIPYHKNGKKLYFKLSEIDEWLTSKSNKKISVSDKLDNYLMRKAS